MWKTISSSANGKSPTSTKKSLGFFFPLPLNLLNPLSSLFELKKSLISKRQLKASCDGRRLKWDSVSSKCVSGNICKLLSIFICLLRRTENGRFLFLQRRWDISNIDLMVMFLMLGQRSAEDVIGSFRKVKPSCAISTSIECMAFRSQTERWEHPSRIPKKWWGWFDLQSIIHLMNTRLRWSMLLPPLHL